MIQPHSDAAKRAGAKLLSDKSVKQKGYELRNNSTRERERENRWCCCCSRIEIIIFNICFALFPQITQKLNIIIETNNNNNNK